VAREAGRPARLRGCVRPEAKHARRLRRRQVRCAGKQGRCRRQFQDNTRAGSDGARGARDGRRDGSSAGIEIE
jgi:hypothetical protein